MDLVARVLVHMNALGSGNESRIGRAHNAQGFLANGGGRFFLQVRMGNLQLTLRGLFITAIDVVPS